MAFCTFGPIWSRNVRLAAWGRSTPFPHAHRENRPIFQNKGFPLNQRWIMCSWTPQDRWGPPEHPRDTSHAFSASCCRLPIRPVRRGIAWHGTLPESIKLTRARLSKSCAARCSGYASPRVPPSRRGPLQRDGGLVVVVHCGLRQQCRLGLVCLCPEPIHHRTATTACASDTVANLKS